MILKIAVVIAVLCAGILVFAGEGGLIAPMVAAKFARRVHCPTLMSHGGPDLNVPLRSTERMAPAVRSNGNFDVTARIFPGVSPGVSHSLLPDPTGLASGWVTLPCFSDFAAASGCHGAMGSREACRTERAVAVRCAWADDLSRNLWLYFAAGLSASNST
jgi:hypothetical protein